MSRPQNDEQRPAPGIEAEVSAAVLESARILALETSGRDASAAVLEVAGDEVRLLQELTFEGSRRTAQVLAPGVQDLLSRVAWKPGDVHFVAVAVGPGSFTGLRIGVTMAKAFAYAVGAQVIGINTLAVLAQQAGLSGGPLWTVMDAQRQELFVARFESAVESLDAAEVQIVPEVDWLAAIQPGDRVTGPALRKLQPQLLADIVVVDESKWQPMAGTVGALGWRAYQAGRRDDLWRLVPQYYRLSAAEEKKPLV